MKKYIERFHNDGFAIVPNILDEYETNYYTIACNSPVFKKHLDSIESGWDFHLLEASFFSKQILELAKNKKIIDLLIPILGENIQIQHTKLTTKIPGKGKGEVSWHQDFAYFPHTNTSLVAVMIALDEITENNGCMKILKKSHKLGLLNHMNNNNYIEDCKEQVWIGNEKNIENIIIPKGGVSIHHCLSLHCSNDNISKKPRTSIVIQYRADDAMQLADSIWKDTGILVSGVRTFNVRCENLHFLLPKSDRYGTKYPFGSAWNQIGQIASK